jgi:hypothetical protein
MSKDDQYMVAAKNILRGVMVTKGVNFVRLAELLSADGVDESPRSIAAKVNRGKFPFSFFLRCMAVLGMAGGFFLVPTREEMLAMESTGLVTNPHDRVKKLDTSQRSSTVRRSSKSASATRKREADLTAE